MSTMFVTLPLHNYHICKMFKSAKIFFEKFCDQCSTHVGMEISRNLPLLAICENIGPRK